MNWKNAYRLTFATYFALFLWLARESFKSAEWPGFVLSAVLAASAGAMTWAAFFRPRH